MEGSTGSRGRRSLLLVDDCAPERNLYEMALGGEFSVLTADRGADGLALAARARPDAIVLDVLMPGMDGWETCTRIKSDPATADIPVILLTGADDRDLSQHAMAVGASALLRKPCPTDRLRERILAVLGAATHPSPPATILVVDDDHGVTEIFARMLELEGYKVFTALDAEAGLREVETDHPDAILLDLRMPLVDGLAFLRRLRAHKGHRETPVAIVTGDYFLDEPVACELRELGATLHFKPLWLEELVGITQRLLERTH